MIPVLSRPILLTDSQFPVKNITMKSFFCITVPKITKKLKCFQVASKIIREKVGSIVKMNVPAISSPDTGCNSKDFSGIFK